VTTREAFKFAAVDPGNPVTDKWLREWKQAEAAIVAAGFCPSCATDRRKVKLLPWQPGNRELYAGRECPECEQFCVCGPQPEYADEFTEPAFSDADPGL